MNLKITLFALILLSPVISQASSDEGMEAAETLCSHLRHASYRNRCLGHVSNADYFQINAVDVCDELTFEVKKVNCVRAIADKTYSKIALKSCSTEVTDTLIVDCLRQSGRRVQSAGFEY